MTAIFGVILIVLFVLVFVAIGVTVFSFTRFGWRGGRRRYRGWSRPWRPKAPRPDWRPPEIVDPAGHRPSAFAIELFDKSIILGQLLYQGDIEKYPTFYSRLHGLSGRPDLVIEDVNGKLIVVENKTGTEGDFPNHTAQIATYFILCAEYYGRPVDYGILAFPGRHFRVENTEDIRDRVLGTLEDMRRKIDGEPCKETRNANKCPNCPVLIQCKGEDAARRYKLRSST